MPKDHENITRAVPGDPHPDMGGRIGFIHTTYPKPGGPRLAQELQSNNGYIRGSRAPELYRALEPYLRERARQSGQGLDDRLSRVDGISVDSWSVEMPGGGESRGFRVNSSSSRRGR